MFDIQRNIPVPAPAPGSRLPKYPFRDMLVGDSFSIPAPGGPDALAKVAYRAYFACQNARKKDRELKFKVRRQVDQVGIWRVA